MEQLHDSLKYRQWKQTLDNNNVTLARIEERCTIRKPNGDVLFSMVEINATAPDGQKILPIALLRGHFVSVLVVFIDNTTQQRHALLVKQYRVANGAICYEFAAGMCDNDSDPFAVAIKEVKEETGFSISRDQLHLMNDELIFSSPGLLDEGGYLFWCEIPLDPNQIAAFQNQSAGAADENEFIMTEVVPLDQVLSKVNSMTSIAQYLWYLRLRP